MRNVLSIHRGLDGPPTGMAASRKAPQSASGHPGKHCPLRLACAARMRPTPPTVSPVGATHVLRGLRPPADRRISPFQSVESMRSSSFTHLFFTDSTPSTRGMPARCQTRRTCMSFRRPCGGGCSRTQNRIRREAFSTRRNLESSRPAPLGTVAWRIPARPPLSSRSEPAQACVARTSGSTFGALAS